MAMIYHIRGKIIKTNDILQGDCLEVMRTFEDNSIDTIITDPPYGLSFMGKKWDYEVPSVEIWQECLRVLKPGGTALIFAGSRTQHRMAVNIEDAGFILKDTIMWLYGSGFPKATDISKQIDKMAGKEREIIGKSNRVIAKNPSATTFVGQNNNFSESAEGREKSKFITAPATPEAQLWNGYKSHGLKPAYEPILLCMKPNEGSYANNALKWDVAGLNIDGGRIGHNEPLKETNRQKDMGNSWDKNNCGLRNNPNNIASANQKGRFPANLILDEEVCNEAGEWKRFFYTAKASKKERNRGCEGLESKPNMRVNAPRENEESKFANKMSNHHPTVKPLALMKYLVTLTMMPNPEQVYLDPFCGSGTTLMACKELGCNYIGIEKEPEYCEIAECRVNATQASLI